MKILNPLFVVPLVTGACFLLGGLLMRRFPPKSINSLYGYRTPASMKSQERWDFAQRYSAVEMMKCSVLLMLTSLAGLWYHPDDAITTIIIVVFILMVAALLIMRVERAIRKKFRD